MRLLAHKTEPRLLMLFSMMDFATNQHRIQEWAQALQQGDLALRTQLSQEGVVDTRIDPDPQSQGARVTLTFQDKTRMEAWVRERWILPYDPNRN